MEKLCAILTGIYFSLKKKATALLVEEDGDVNVVAIVVLIGVAVLLAIVFKDAIGSLIKNLLNTITNNASNVVNTPVGG